MKDISHRNGKNVVGWAGPKCPCCKEGMSKKDAQRYANQVTRRTKTKHIKESIKGNT
jgi:hypothetical protein